MDRFLQIFQLSSIMAFVLLFAGRTLALRRLGIEPIRLFRGKPLHEALLEGLLVLALPIWLYESFADAWPLAWHFFRPPVYLLVLDHPAARIAGCALITAGIALFAAALHEFGDSWRVGIDREAPGELVCSGVFGMSRNPIFLFMDVYAVGMFLLTGRLFFGVFALLAIAAIHLQIRREEVFLEVPRLLRMGGPMRGGRALEIGCGRGVGSELILDCFGAEHVDAFDLDPSMVQRARRRLARRGDAASVRVGDACHIDAADGHYDAAFDFGILHHVPTWRDAIVEIHRVLRPGGRFYVEEIFQGLTERPWMRRITVHPKEACFDHDEFCCALDAGGFEVDASQDLANLAGLFIATRRQDGAAVGL